MLSINEKLANFLECKKCGYKWIPRKSHPKACPECKSRSWNK